MSSLTSWTSHCGVRFPTNVKLAQKVSPPSGSSSLPMRGIFTDRRISRGQLIAVVPHDSLVSPRAATQFLHRSGSSSSTSSSSSSFTKAAISCADLFSAPASKRKLSSASVWFSRDQLLVVAALSQWRWQREMNNTSSSSWPVRQGVHALDDYLSTLPRSRPKVLLQKGGKGEEQPLVDRYATPLDPHSRRRQQRAEPKLKVPTSSIDPNECIVGTFHLTTEQQLGLLEHAVHRAAQKFIEQISSSSSSSQSVSPDSLRRLREIFEWSHFVVRSRSLCPSLQSSSTATTPKRMSTFDRDDQHEQEQRMMSHESMQPRLVPFVDMLNHTMTSSNVTASWNRNPALVVGDNDDEVGQEVIVTATRDIEAGEELRMNYASFDQRGQFMFAPRLDDSDDAASNTAASNMEPLRQLLRAQRAAGVSEDALSWRWQFGFDIAEPELQHTRELMWARSLRGRIRRMMNVRRRGHPGEFVVGVPEGLASLRAQRARVEKDVYGGKTVFPVSRE